MKYLVLLQFVATYFLIMLFRKKALYIIGFSVLILFITKALNPIYAFKSIDFNVLGVFLGTMILSSLFISSNVPAYLTDLIVHYSKKTHIAFLAICGLAAFISSFTENIATVLIVAPLALELVKRLKIDPTLLLIGISISSNLQGTATLIGDAPSILLATTTGMTFNDFFWMDGNFGIFFAVQLGAIGSFIVLYLFYRKFKQNLPVISEKAGIKTLVPSIFMICMVLNLVIVSALKIKSPYVLAIVCIFWAVCALVWHYVKPKEQFSLKKDIDWYSIFFLIGIFVLVGSLTYSGIINDLAEYLIKISQGNVLKAYVMIVVFSVIISAFVDNIPYTIAMIPLTIKMAESMNVSIYLFLFGLLIGTCLGGNITPIGSSSNIVTMGILKQNGYPVQVGKFVKLGLPFTIAAVTFGATFIWFVWR